MRSKLWANAFPLILAAIAAVGACVGDDPSSSTPTSDAGSASSSGTTSSGATSSGATSSSGTATSSGTTSSGGSSGDAASDGPPPFNPGKIAGLVVWLDADDTSTFTLASASKVSKWSDKSSAANHANGVAGAEPTRATSATLGNKNVVHFTGPGQAAAVTDNASLYFQDTDEFVVATVVSFTHAGVGGFVSKTNFPTNDKGILLFTVTTAQVCFAIDGVCGDFTVATGAFHRIIAHRLPGGTKLQTFVDGVMLQDRTVTATDVSAGGHDLVIGADRKNGTTITEGMTGDIAEVVVYHTAAAGTAITDTQLTDLDGYLKTKWGL